MKNIYKLIIPILLCFAIPGCEHITIGYLFTDNLSYTPDSLVIKAELDPVIDKEQITNQIPWQSPALEGVQGTAPISYTIERVRTADGNPDKVSQFKMVRKGIIELPWDHTVPPGKYIFTIRVTNEGRSIVKDSVFTIIVKTKN